MADDNPKQLVANESLAWHECRSVWEYLKGAMNATVMSSYGIQVQPRLPEAKVGLARMKVALDVLDAVIGKDD